MDTSATIIAISSPPGHSAHGLIRLSGAHSVVAVNNCCESSIESQWRGVRTMRFIIDGSRNTTLPILVMSFPSPNSYTGEDVIELRCPGNPMLLDRIVQEVIDRSKRAIDEEHLVRRAEPGEFTARAYWHGRLTLTQAEGVAAAIAARSDEELETARLLLSEDFGDWARSSGDELTQLLGLVEAGIDFTDQEDVVAIEPDVLHKRILAIQERWQQWLGHHAAKEHPESTPWVVITGPPNAGKSTLFNALLGKTRAVSSPVAGTTRDVLTERLTVPSATGSVACILVDVAGWDKRTGQLDSQMQIAATTALERATVQIACEPSPHHGSELSSVISVRTKADQIGEADLSSGARQPLAVSALSGVGIESLRSSIGKALSETSTSLTRATPSLMAKHRQALVEASQALAEAGAMTALSESRQLQDAELVAAALRDALTAMMPLIGHVPPDDVLDHVFASFCIGK